MTPTVDERLASMVRSLTEVVLPHLPPEASLAHEQVHLAIGHLQILRAQIDAAPGFERGEWEDAVAMAQALGEGMDGGPATHEAAAALAEAVRAADGSDCRGQTAAIHRAIDRLVVAVSLDGSPDAREQLPAIILHHEAARVAKDRRWFLPFGFDSMEPGA